MTTIEALAHLMGRLTPTIALIATGLLLTPAESAHSTPAPQTPGLARVVSFTHYEPLFSNSEVIRRLLSPLAQEFIRDTLARTRKTLSPYAIDLAKERFVLYVPPGPPPSPRGFALLVFVPPRDGADLPFGWASQLGRFGMIFVAPAHAGNKAGVLSRRVPLALSAEANVVREYPIDPEHIYVAGFSGGSRVAERLALSYPDVFHGALLNAGADPVGNSRYPFPSRDLFLRFQSSSRLIYVTGARDVINLGTDAASSQSIREWCVANVERNVTADAGHEVMTSEALGQALDRLLDHAPHEPARLATCRSRIDAELQSALMKATGLISSGRREAARKLLLDIDSRYGNLAAPHILELARQCRCGLAR